MKQHVFKTGFFAVCVLAAALGNIDIGAQTELETQSVDLAENINIGDRLGRIRFLGMLALPDITHEGIQFSQLSGLAWDDDDGILYAISDKGGLFHLQPIFKGGMLTGLRLLRAVSLRELGSNIPLKWKRADSEGLDILNGRNRRKGDAELVISFEHYPRIVRYHTDGRAIGEYPLPAPLNNAENYVSNNKMLESVCVDPALGIVTAAEVPLQAERNGYTRISSLSGLSWLYPYAPGDRITAMECLGNGEVLVLQQNYRNPFANIVTMLKRVHLAVPASSQLLKPDTLVTMDSKDGFHIDNFEGLARHKGKRFFIVSDNNDLFLQRTLLMYFELLDE